MNKRNLLSWGFVGAAATALFAGALCAADEPGEELIQMIANLVSDKDKEMRAVGLQQVREEAKGPAATKRFAGLLPKLSPEAQAALLDALADRGDAVARPAVLEMLKSQEEPVRAASLRALGSLGEVSDVPLLAKSLETAPAAEKTAALASLTRLQGQGVNAAIVAELKAAKPDARILLIDVLASRRAKDTVPSLLAGALDADAEVRTAAMAALGQLAEPENTPDMLQAVLKAKPGPEREAAEKAVLLVCNRTKDASLRADPLLAAIAKLGADQQTALLSTLGRVGGPAALIVVEAAIADKNPQRQDAGIHALCNWPDASVVAKLMDLAQTSSDASHRVAALRALIRVAALADKRSNAERLALLEKAMTLATRDEERNLVVRRARAIRTVESLRFAAPYMDQPALAQEACLTVVELAHHRELREPNKAEFDKALDAVIRISKDADVVDRAQRYKKNQTRQMPVS